MDLITKGFVVETFERKCSNINCNNIIIYKNKDYFFYIIKRIKNRKHSGLCKRCSKIGDKNPNFGKHPTKKTLELLKISRRKYFDENKEKYGKGLSPEVCKQISIRNKGKHHNIISKQKIGLSSRKRMLRKIEELGIPTNEDIGSKEWFNNYNKETNSHFKSTSFLNSLGYVADGYDENKHIWIEYDTEYHKRNYQIKKDLIRQNNIIKYFENIGEPLVEFNRFITWENKLKTLYKGYEY